MTTPPEPSPRRRDSPTGEQFGRVVRQIRLEREMNLQALAKASGLHWTYLSGIERGHRNPSLRVVAAIAGSFELSTAELVRRAEQVHH
ncbi:MAG TPA: helix-turn-helix transcriptional regulator [Solirubrobacterales bacterium]|nr:helix-turn-helix transcriptional regulator [Solirubrobacterales bacterium]